MSRHDKRYRSEAMSPGARDRQVDEGKNNEAVQEESDHDGEEVESQLGQLVPEVLRLEDLASDQEADADRREVDDPGGELRDGELKRKLSSV